MSKKEKQTNLRAAVDTVFRQTSPPTPTRVVRNALTSDDSADMTVGVGKTSTEALPFMVARPKMQREESIANGRTWSNNDKLSDAAVSEVAAAGDSSAGETQLETPAIAAISVNTGDSAQPKTRVSNNRDFWTVLFVLLAVVAISLALWHANVLNWIQSLFVGKSKPQSVASRPAAQKAEAPSIAKVAPSVAPTKTIYGAERRQLAKAIERSKNLPMPAKPVVTKTTNKRVRFNESQNTVKEIPSNLQNQSMSDSSDNNIAGASEQNTLSKLEVSLDKLQKTTADLERARNAALSATNQQSKGNVMRLDERQQFSQSECVATLPIEDARHSAETIYDKYGGNSVVGNRNKAPFVTFAPGEEPVEGMIPDYDESVHSEAADKQPAPLKSGEAHSIMELVSDHCLRNGKPMPKAAEKSTLDVHSKKDAATHAGLHTADYDGHYLQSQKKQFELFRMNRDAVKGIYDAKDASATGHILDRGSSALSSFAGAQDDDAVQFLNVNSL